MQKKIKILISVLLIPFLSGCIAVATMVDKDISPHKIAKSSGFKKAYLKTKDFTLTAYYRFTNPGAPINIYIEGDGNAWMTSTRLSNNPTPKIPLVLKLMSLDPGQNVAYLARPGQYIANKTVMCDSAYWSGKRFSEEVIVSMSEAIDQLALLAKANKINLIGYSGGAAVAVLIAAQRNDITSLRTIAGNLDPDAVNKYHQVSLLSGSLNPIDVAQKIKNLPQRHFVGSNDDIVPGFIAESFVRRMGDKNYSRITVVSDATHTKGWRENWKELLGYPTDGIQDTSDAK